MPERAHDFATCRIAVSVENAIPAVRTLACKQQTRSFPIERGSPFDELLNRSRCLFDQRMHSFNITETVARSNRVLFVKLNLIVVAKRGGDSALSIFGGRLSQTVFGNDQNVARRRQLDSGSQACYACSDNDEIRLNALNGSGDTVMISPRIFLV